MPRNSIRPRTRPNPESSLGFLVYKAHQRSFAEFRRRLETLRLTPQQFGVLAFLCQEDHLTQAELGERGAIDPNTLVGIVDRLEAAGLVQRCRDARDRRAHRLHITARGRRLLERCLPLQAAANEHCWSGLTAAERDRLRTLLSKALRSWKPSYGREVHENG